jgi:uncharacterized protein (DUF433 family)
MTDVEENMPTVQKSLRMPDGLARAITDAAEATGKDFTTLANELLAEAVAMRRCPGIAFMDGATGRRAVVAGTGVDVWEVMYAFEHAGRDVGRLRQAFPHLSEPQLRAALAHATCYPEDIHRRIAANDAWTPERIAAEFPAFVPPRS